MKLNEAFPSKTLTAADLGGGDQRVTIKSVGFGDLGGEKKLMVTLAETPKQWVLNVTNARAVALQCGEDTDDWTGKLVTLYPAYVEFRGEQVLGIRVRPPQVQPTGGSTFGNAQEGAQAAQEGTFGGIGDVPPPKDSDDIPF